MNIKKPMYTCVLLALAAHTTINAQCVQPLDSNTWQYSQWISAVDAPVVTGRVDEHTRAADGASWFVSTIHNDKKVICAKWMTTGLGIYRLYVNGTSIGDEVLKPGFTDCFKTKRSFTYDVTRHFAKKKGASNTLSVEVTPGWWADKIITPSGSNGMYGTKCAFRGVLELTYSDGEKALLGTDTTHWRAAIAGPVTHAAIFDGETYDARKKYGHDVADSMKLAEENKEFHGTILPTNGAEIYHRNDLALTPVKCYVWKETEGKSDSQHGKVKILREYTKGTNMMLHEGEHLVIDFGQNAAAVPDFIFKAKEGVTLTCLPAELLNDGNGAKSRGMDGPEGSVHRQNLRLYAKSIRLDYTFADSDKFVAYRPQKTFFGYRFVSLTATGDVEIKSIKSIPVSSITREMETGSITTGNESINRLISNTIWGQRSNYLSVPTDCPQRNERLGWTADTQVFAATGSFFANTDRFFHKWMHDMRDSQNAEGGYPSVSPHGQYGSQANEYMRFGWSDAGIIVPWTVWKQFGDKTIIDECWQSMERYISHINDTRYDHTLLKKENGNYQWGDWLSYEPLETCGGSAFGKDGALPETIEYWNYLGASYWIIDAKKMQDMAQATGRDAAKYTQMVSKAKTYVRERFLNADGTFKTDIFNTMQTPALFALANGILDGEARTAMIARLRANFASHGNCLQTGFLGTSILMETLTANDMTDIAYALLFQRNNPSWLYSVDNGATTIWERWNSYMKDKGMGPRGMNSFNHYAYGCVCQWLWETAAGICSDISNPGFRHIIMRPLPDRRLHHVNAVYPSASGTIKSSWHFDGNTWVWKFTIPKGATATVTLPGDTTSKEYQAGTYTIKKKI